jgi:hypothetical protein
MLVSFARRNRPDAARLPTPRACTAEKSGRAPVVLEPVAFGAPRRQRQDRVEPIEGLNREAVAMLRHGLDPLRDAALECLANDGDLEREIRLFHKRVRPERGYQLLL